MCHVMRVMSQCVCDCECSVCVRGCSACVNGASHVCVMCHVMRVRSHVSEESWHVSSEEEAKVNMDEVSHESWVMSHVSRDACVMFHVSHVPSHPRRKPKSIWMRWPWSWRRMFPLCLSLSCNRYCTILYPATHERESCFNK